MKTEFREIVVKVTEEPSVPRIYVIENKVTQETRFIPVKNVVEPEPESE